jgi:hypothetical protein
MSRCISVIISVTWPVARGSPVGGMTFSERYASSNCRVTRVASAHHGSPSSSEFWRILSSMSVTFWTSSTS